MRFASLTLLCLALAVIPASAQTLYSNGPTNGTVDAWTINFGFIVSDSFTVAQGGGVHVTGFTMGVWEYPGDTALTVDWSITSAENGGTLFGSGTASVADTFVSTNQFGFDIDTLTTQGVSVYLGDGTYWLNIQNATTSFGEGLFWDENSGPSSASESAVGTIASEAFDIIGDSSYTSTTPEPSSIMLFGTGILGLAGVLRRRL